MFTPLEQKCPLSNKNSQDMIFHFSGNAEFSKLSDDFGVFVVLVLEYKKICMTYSEELSRNVHIQKIGSTNTALKFI